MAIYQAQKINVCLVKTGENIIAAYMRTKGISKSSVAERLQMSAQNFQKKIAKRSLDSDFIQQLSVAMDHNFFEDYSREYQRKHFNVNSVVEEPIEKYGETTLDGYLKGLVFSEVKRILKK